MKIAMLGNTDLSIYNYRFELVQRLIDDGHEVIIVCPDGKYVKNMLDAGCKCELIEMDRHGKNPFKELKLMKSYKRILKKVRPDMVFTYTIKPNIYGAMACKKLNIPCVVNITGLGTAVENKGIMQMITTLLYKKALKNVQTILFQNEENMKFFEQKNIYREKHKLIPGSGVNLSKFSVTEYPSSDEINFAFISRIMKEKGIEEYLEAAKIIKERYDNVNFNVYGFCEEEYDGNLHKYAEQGIVNYVGMVDNVNEVYSKTHCTIMPTYYPEGLCNVLLESCACARPIITTDRSGCREVVDDCINGFVVKEKDVGDLVDKIEKFLNMSSEEKSDMGKKGRKKVEEQFDRNIIVSCYLNEIKKMKFLRK